MPLSMLSLSRMTETGVTRFEEYLQNAKDGATDPFPEALLTETRYAVVIKPQRVVTYQQFATTRDLVRSLHEVVESLTLPGKYYNQSLWAWISAFYLDAICPATEDGVRKVGELNRYLPPKRRSFRINNRHLLSLPTLLYDLHGDARTRLFTYTAPNEKSDILRLIAEQQELTMNGSLLDALHALYWDAAVDKPKRGLRDTAGGIERFIAVVNQLNLTFDLFAMTGEQILDLLPQREFGRWRS